MDRNGAIEATFKFKNQKHLLLQPTVSSSIIEWMDRNGAIEAIFKFIETKNAEIGVSLKLDDRCRQYTFEEKKSK